MPKQEFNCAWCGKTVIRWAKNPQGKEIKNHFCDRTCKGNWQRKQREDLGYTKEWLYEQYITKGRTANDIAKEINRDSKRVWEWLRDYGIETRKRGYGNPDVWIKKGTKFPNRKLSEETKEKIRQARLKDGRVPYLVNGKHWLKQEGVHSPAWKGGVTSERQTIYSSPKWKEAVKKVWKRDNATCQLCGKHQSDDKNNKFHIHHLYPFAEYERLRTNPDNLVLLCKDCHNFVHSKKNTELVFMLKPLILPEWLKGDKSNE
jgi:thymidylate synthase (FAD)